MKITVVGSGGREHALLLALKKSNRVSQLWAWPGNDGIFCDAEKVPVEKQKYIEFCDWCVAQGMDLVVIGPEAELVAGLSDMLRARKIATMGPSQKAAQLEGSKIFAKDFMLEFAVPTAQAKVVSSVEQTLASVDEFKPPYILKADGLAAGKGVFICSTQQELKASAARIFEEKVLGSAGERALLEENLPGEEISVLVLTNGEKFEWLPVCRDHKRLLDGDKGPNTGGMGVVGPIELEESLKTQIEEQIIKRTIRGIQERSFIYRGVIFIGIMLTANGPKVLEYNVRFGDPETQVIVSLLDGDWAVALKELAEGKMPTLKWLKQKTACLVLAAENYPDQPVLGVPINFYNGLPVSGYIETGRLMSLLHNQSTQLSENDANKMMAQILHAGTRKQKEQFVTQGGRVLNVVARANTLRTALRTAYAVVDHITWPGQQYRRDIGKSVLDQ